MVVLGRGAVSFERGTCPAVAQVGVVDVGGVGLVERVVCEVPRRVVQVRLVWLLVRDAAVGYISQPSTRLDILVNLLR